MKFENPWLLLLLLFIPAYFFLKYRGFGKGKTRLNLTPTLLFSANELFSSKNSRIGRFFDIAGEILLSSALLFLIVASARPLGGQDITNERTYGIDIVLAIDVSGSMLFVDSMPVSLRSRDILGTRIFYDPTRRLLEYNRLNSAKQVIAQYIEKQKFNRIGIVVFANYSFPRCPLTLDKQMLNRILKDIQFRPENNGTAIGMGIASAVNRLKNSEAKSKVIILLTDGVNNSGMVDPLSAAQIARDLGIRIYTIGVGNPSGYLEPANLDLSEYFLRTGEGIDAQSLMEIARITGGKFYKAEDPDSLKQIYDDIDKLEKSRIDIKRRVLFKENFMPFLLTGFILLAGYILLTNLVIKIP